jgi:cytosine/adenosine deaminase-related metal-dependent hydrolase
VTIFRGAFLDTPDDPFTGGVLRSGSDLGLLVRDGVIEERDDCSVLRARHRDEDVVDLSGGLVLPGLVDTHVHYPQLRMIAALGQLPGVEVFPSAANFLLLRVPDADKAVAAMVAEKVLIKNLSKMHALLANCIRVTVSTPQENTVFLNILTASLTS